MGIVYTKLRFKDEIRLVRLEPGIGTSQLTCNIVHARLGESPTYDALSYMWGEDRSGKGHLLQVDEGRTIEIRENLWNALRCLRLKDKVRVLWVDAVCINQAEDEERGHQVAQMGMIYSQATTVRVWLGLPDNTSALAFQFLNSISTVRNMSLAMTESSDWEAIAKLCEREYWNRLWIIQEIVLAARIEIHCGERFLPWEAFSDVLFALEECFQTYNTEKPQWAREILVFDASAKVITSAAMKVCQQRRANTDTGPARDLTSLMSLLWIHKSAKCADVRDKIFGMHSFAPACCRETNPVDYSCSAFTICRRLLENDISCHSSGTGGREALIGRSRDLHHLILGGTLRKIGSNNPFDVGNLSLEEERAKDEGRTQSARGANRFKIAGRKHGEVVFVTPPLSCLFIGSESVRIPSKMVYSFSLTNLGSKDTEDPALTTQITTALGLVWGSKRGNTGPDESNQAFTNVEMVNLNSLALAEESTAYRLQTMMRFAAEFLRTNDILRTQPVYEDCVMMLSEGGNRRILGFAPLGTRIGDALCMFQGSDVMAIVRNIDGSYRVVGQASGLDNSEVPATASPVDQRTVLEAEVLELQAFSFNRIRPPCELPDYRIVLTIPPRQPMKNPNLRQGIRTHAGALRVPGYSRREAISHEIHSEWPDDGQEPPEYSRCFNKPSTGDRHKRRLKYTILVEGRYACPRCDARFLNVRDNLMHAATWSHQQCKNCQRWTSWQSDTSKTSTTPFCTQCRIRDPSCAPWTKD